MKKEKKKSQEKSKEKKKKSPGISSSLLYIISIIGHSQVLSCRFIVMELEKSRRRK